MSGGEDVAGLGSAVDSVKLQEQQQEVMLVDRRAHVRRRPPLYLAATSKGGGFNAVTARCCRNCVSHEKVKNIWALSAHLPVFIGSPSDGALTASKEWKQNKQQGGALV